jgi:hypothetical protein
MKQWCCNISQVGKGGMPPLWSFSSLGKNKRAGAWAGSPAGQPRWGAKPPFLTLRLPSIHESAGK